MNGKQWVSAVLIVALTGLGGSWAWGYWKERSQLNKIEQLRAELFSEASRELPPEERRARWEELRAEAELLSPAQRERLREEGRQRWEERAEERLAEFFAMPDEQRKQELDRQIDQMEAWRQRAEQRRSEGQRNNADGSPSNVGAGSRPGGAQL